MRRAVRLGWVLAWVLCMVILSPTAKAEGDCTKDCEIITSNNRDVEVMRDGNYRSYWSTKGDGAYVDIIADGIGGIVVSWSYQPEVWELMGSNDQEHWEVIKKVTDQRFIQQHIKIEKPYSAYRIQLPDQLSEESRYGISEINIYQGDAPPTIHRWGDTVEKAELMVVSAHADDETVFFGGSLPYYSGEMGKDTVVVFMATNNYVRRHEALNALWTSGVRTYPVFAPFPDEYSRSIEECRKYWGTLKKVTRYLVKQICTYQPEVVITHDVNGEYGHGAHIMTAAAMLDAVILASDTTYDPESMAGFEPWDVKKLYLHLDKEHKVVMDCFDEPLEAFGGKTAIEVAKDALHCHASQMKWEVVRVHEDGRYNCRKYGLAYSSVGYDDEADFFAAVPTPTPIPTATPSPTPTVAPTPTATPVVTVTPTPTTEAQPTLWQRFIAWLKGLFGV